MPTGCPAAVRGDFISETPISRDGRAVSSHEPDDALVTASVVLPSNDARRSENIKVCGWCPLQGFAGIARHELLTDGRYSRCVWQGLRVVWAQRKS